MVVYLETNKRPVTSLLVLLLSSDDPILALPVFPLWECEDQLGAQTICYVNSRLGSEDERVK